MRTARLLAAALGTGSFLGVASVAHGCSCAPPGVTLKPAGNVRAPTNAVVQLTFPVLNADSKEPTLEVQRVGEDGRPLGKPIEVTQEAVVAHELRIVTVRPKSLLAPDSRYEVRVPSWGRVAPENRGAEQVLPGTFTTGKSIDHEAPKWGGIAKATYHQRRPAHDCDLGDWFATIELADESTNSSDIALYGVWLVKEAKFDHRAAPISVLDGFGATRFLGRRGYCTLTNFRFPEMGASQSIAVWIAPIDLTGRSGKPARVVIDLVAGPPWPPQ